MQEVQAHAEQAWIAGVEQREWCGALVERDQEHVELRGVTLELEDEPVAGDASIPAQIELGIQGWGGYQEGEQAADSGFHGRTPARGGS